MCGRRIFPIRTNPTEYFDGRLESPSGSAESLACFILLNGNSFALGFRFFLSRDIRIASIRTVVILTEAEKPNARLSLLHASICLMATALHSDSGFSSRTTYLSLLFVRSPGLAEAEKPNARLSLLHASICLMATALHSDSGFSSRATYVSLLFVWSPSQLFAFAGLPQNPSSIRHPIPSSLPPLGGRFRRQ